MEQSITYFELLFPRRFSLLLLSNIFAKCQEILCMSHPHTQVLGLPRKAYFFDEVISYLYFEWVVKTTPCIPASSITLSQASSPYFFCTKCCTLSSRIPYIVPVCFMPSQAHSDCKHSLKGFLKLKNIVFGL